MNSEIVQFSIKCNTFSTCVKIYLRSFSGSKPRKLLKQHRVGEFCVALFIFRFLKQFDAIWFIWLKPFDGCPLHFKYCVFQNSSHQSLSVYSVLRIFAMAGNRTRVNCLEGSYAHHYTTIACWNLKWFDDTCTCRFLIYCQSGE